jgi:hypothetical protein
MLSITLLKHPKGAILHTGSQCKITPKATCDNRVWRKFPAANERPTLENIDQSQGWES